MSIKRHPCCLPNGTCRLTGETECRVRGGHWRDDVETCDETYGCEGDFALRVCCLHDGTCVLLNWFNCTERRGLPSGFSVCEPNPCQSYDAPQACCLPDGTCMYLQPGSMDDPVAGSCRAYGGTPFGDIECDDINCGALCRQANDEDLPSPHGKYQTLDRYEYMAFGWRKDENHDWHMTSMRECRPTRDRHTSPAWLADDCMYSDATLHMRPDGIAEWLLCSDPDDNDSSADSTTRWNRGHYYKQRKDDSSSPVPDGRWAVLIGYENPMQMEVRYDAQLPVCGGVS